MKLLIIAISSTLLTGFVVGLPGPICSKGQVEYLQPENGHYEHSCIKV